MTIADQAPAYIRAISPYQPGKPITALAREMGLAESSIVKLASNENPRGMSPKARAAVEAALAGVERAGGDDGSGRHQFTAGWGSQEGLQIGRADSVDDAKNPALVMQEATGGIAE